MTAGPGGPSDRPKRRPRYRGTHPRTFGEKYKERDPARYPEEFEKVKAAGKTPAGAHVPILVEEVLRVLDPKPGEIAVDATLGWGGHATALLPRLLPGGRVVGVDVDPVELPKAEARLRAAGFGEDEFVARRSNFAGLRKVLAGLGLERVDLVLADLGVSSMQLDDPTRGFSYKREAPLDLRMNPSRGQPASRLLASIPEETLREILLANADEPRAEFLARAVVSARREAPIDTTSRLAAVLRGALATLPERARREEGDAPLARVFQALRIDVNEEMAALDTLLRDLPSLLAPRGRVAFLSFHSGEDRRVKKALQTMTRSGALTEFSREPIRPTPEEIRSNPRAAAAKLRWGRRA